MCRDYGKPTYHELFDPFANVNIIITFKFNVLERRGSAVVSTSPCHAGGPGSRPGPGTLLGVKTWLSTLEIVYLCVFRMRH